MDLSWYTVLLVSSFCLCRGASIAHSENNCTSQFDRKNGSHLASHNQRPSPIDITLDDIVEEDLPPLNNPFANPEFEHLPVECINDGMTISCSVNESSAILRGGPFKDDYVFDTMHFHWGKSDLSGSEHTLDGRRFASELHAIFRNKKYPDLKTASEMDDGLGILAWLGMPSEEDSNAMSKLFATAEKLIEFNTKERGEAGPLLGFLKGLAEPLNENSTDWVTYNGALTMEPYSDSVKWIIYEIPYAISHRQLEIQRHLKRQDGTPNLEHSKDVVPLGGRSIYLPVGGEFDTNESNLKQHIMS